jgi:broad specificity phosphatase PhoE
VALAQAVKALAEPPDLIVTSDLRRAQDTAAIVRAALGAVDLVVQPAFRERRLGEWNLQPIAATEVAAGQRPHTTRWRVRR